MKEETVFSIDCPPLSDESSVGEFLESFEAVAELAPSYLPPGDWQRHSDFVQFLKTFSTPHWRVDRSGKPKAAEDYQLGDLEILLHKWVASVVEMDNAHPLAATFALETATILSKHARGDDSYGHGNIKLFRLEAMVKSDVPHWQSIADQELKKNITQRTLTALVVVAKVPDGVLATLLEEKVDCSSRRVFFRVERCHQSQGSGDQAILHFSGGDWEPFDLSDNFEFFGRVNVGCRQDLQEPIQEWWRHDPVLRKIPQAGDYLATAYLPIRWIAACSYPGFEERRLTPIPTRWLTFEGDDTPTNESPSPGLKVFNEDEP